MTDTAVYVGSDGNLLEDCPKNCAVLRLERPILSNTDLMRIENAKGKALHVARVSMLYYRSESLESALGHLFVACDRAYKNGANVLNKVDRASAFSGLALQPGINVYSFAADYGDNNLHVVIRYNKQYLGV